MTNTDPAETKRQAAFEAALQRATRAWERAGGPKGLKEALPALYEDLVAAQAGLDQAWLGARNSDIVLPEDFLAALDRWEQASIQAAAMMEAMK